MKKDWKKATNGAKEQMKQSKRTLRKQEIKQMSQTRWMRRDPFWESIKKISYSQEQSVLNFEEKKMAIQLPIFLKGEKCILQVLMN